MKIAINGFGRIGRTLAKTVSERSGIQLAAVNDLAPIETIAHLLKYDSVHGRYKGEIRVEGDFLVIDGNKIRYLQAAIPERLPWGELGIDTVVESTGKFRTKEEAEQHLKAGSKRVIISAPAKGSEVKTVVLGINEDILNPEDTIISNASCTTNSAAPLIKIVDDLCGIESAYITTIHSYTSDQRLHDAPHSDLRRARAAAVSIIPTTTGAAKAITKIFPHLDGKMGGCGIRVPVPDGSLTDINCIVKNPQSIEKINETFKSYADNQLKGILEYSEDPLVSVDIVGNPHSSIFDAKLTSVIGNMVKVVGWYDNEAGYANRIADLIKKLG